MSKRSAHGVVFATPDAGNILGEEGKIVRKLLRKHRHSKLINASGQRISIHIVSGAGIWVVTEADRSKTTFLVAAEYLSREYFQGAAN